MEFVSPYPGLSPSLITSHFPYGPAEPLVLLELYRGGPLWVPYLSSELPNARFIVFAINEAAEQAARVRCEDVKDRTRFFRADWLSGAWETKLPAGFHVVFAPFVAFEEDEMDQQILIGRLSGKLREGGMLFWGTEIQAGPAEQEADYERRLRDYRGKAGIELPVGERSGGLVRPKWEQVRRWVESASLSNADLLWKQELAAVITGMKRV